MLNRNEQEIDKKKSFEVKKLAIFIAVFCLGYLASTIGYIVLN